MSNKTIEEKPKSNSRSAIAKTRVVENPPRSKPATRLQTFATASSKVGENPPRRKCGDASTASKVAEVPKGKGPPPRAATCDSNPVDEVLYHIPDKVVSHTVSTTDGKFA